MRKHNDTHFCQSSHASTSIISFLCLFMDACVRVCARARASEWVCTRRAVWIAWSTSHHSSAVVSEVRPLPV